MSLGITFELVSLAHPRHGPRESFEAMPQYNRDLHLVHTLRGQGRLRVGHRTFDAAPGRVLAPPVFTHCSWDKKAGPAWEMLNIHYRLLTVQGVPIELGLDLPVAFQPADHARICRTLVAAEKQSRAGTPLGGVRVAASLCPLIAEYWSAFARPIQGRNPMDTAMAQLANQIRSPQAPAFEAADLAKAVHLSVSQMNRRFRRTWGVSPKEFWMRHRLARAQDQLRASNTKIQAVAEALGFCDAYYFSKWFTQHTGRSPSRFRNECGGASM